MVGQLATGWGTDEPIGVLPVQRFTLLFHPPTPA
ncbi:MAG: hypothetical protein QOF40_2983 [Actinomycetota bacterium]|nr:hypothetical protein [Actinomycetota bacterium]